jgi:hypothetical protein
VLRECVTVGDGGVAESRVSPLPSDSPVGVGMGSSSDCLCIAAYACPVGESRAAMKATFFLQPRLDAIGYGRPPWVRVRAYGVRCVSRQRARGVARVRDRRQPAPEGGLLAIPSDATLMVVGGLRSSLIDPATEGSRDLERTFSPSPP